MTRRVAPPLLAVLCIGALLQAPVLAAQAADADVQVQVSEARRHFEALEYEQAIPLADRAIAVLRTQQGDAAKRTLAQALEIRARARFGMNETDAARQDFIDLLKADPAYVLPRGVSPRIAPIFDDAKKRTVATLQLTLDPPDATVLVDGTTLAKGGNVPVVAGRHSLAVSRMGYERRLDEITAEPGAVVPRTLTLKRVSAVLSVVTSPADVEVVIDGVSRGRTIAGPPSAELASRVATAGFSQADETGVLSLENIAPGSHRIELKRACFASVERAQPVVQLTDYILEPTKLAPATASIAIAAKQADGIVYVDGESRGRAPHTAQVCEGPHVVELRAPTGRFLQRLDARVGQRLEVTGSLRPAFALVSGTQTSLNADLRTSMERALQPLSSVLVFAPPADTLATALKAEGLPPDWLSYDINRRPLGVSGEVTASMRRDLSTKLSKVFDVQGIASVTAPVASNRNHLVLTLLGAGIAEPDVLDLNLDQPETVTRALAQLDRTSAVLGPTIGATLVDVVDQPGPIVIGVDANGPATRGGLQVGDVVLAAGGQPVPDGSALAAAIAQRQDGQTLALDVQDKSGTRRAVGLTVQVRPRVLGVADQSLLTNRTLVALRARLSEASSPAEQASIRLNLAAALVRLEAWTDARAELQQVTLADGPGVGPGTVQYLLGLCYAQLGNRTEAETAFTSAAASASLLTEDGPPVRELAQTRLAELRRAPAR